MFIEELLKCASIVYNMGVLKNFVEDFVGGIELFLFTIKTFWSIRTF